MYTMCPEVLNLKRDRCAVHGVEPLTENSVGGNAHLLFVFLKRHDIERIRIAPLLYTSDRANAINGRAQKSVRRGYDVCVCGATSFH